MREKHTFEYYEEQLTECIDLAKTSRRAYCYWKDQKGVKAFVKTKLYLTLNRYFHFLVKYWLNAQMRILKREMEGLA